MPRCRKASAKRESRRSESIDGGPVRDRAAHEQIGTAPGYPGKSLLRPALRNCGWRPRNYVSISWLVVNVVGLLGSSTGGPLKLLVVGGTIV